MLREAFVLRVANHGHCSHVNLGPCRAAMMQLNYKSLICYVGSLPGLSSMTTVRRRPADPIPRVL